MYICGVAFGERQPKLNWSRRTMAAYTHCTVDSEPDSGFMRLKGSTALYRRMGAVVIEESLRKMPAEKYSLDLRPKVLVRYRLRSRS
jgi:hypothetical protein